MGKYEEGLALMNERFGNKDNVISLATMTTDANGTAIPAIREVDAYYEDGAFYVVTYAKSGKMQQIAENSKVAFLVNMGWFCGNGNGENLGWVLEPKNAEIRNKLRAVFANWYDEANNESDENCCILKIQFSNVVIAKEQGAVRYNLDFDNQKIND